ncbi:hypothetical protein M2451_004025 [Dysgonomonas sp. PFB1-18]|nr:hypothetical protein [Dysgonomonas sp. PF1-14]MDH6340907.1 hypothetical protein [Dysgonomonas sp. PF1-16]MDH6382678.1 hypothetical protein [Dysgonomonas sp. PFB1-18]MDH6399898.1 hypothetical protein [Dysgonomonas sp. PF1-23]
MKNWKVTPFFIAYPLSIIFFILYIYSRVWTPFSLIFIIGFIIVVSFIFFMERLIINKMNLKGVWIVEFIIILLLSLFCLSNYILE